MTRSDAEKYGNRPDESVLPVAEGCSVKNGLQEPIIEYGNRSNAISEPDAIITTCNSIIEMSVQYPEENPFNAVDDIVKAMAYVGLFDGM